MLLRRSHSLVVACGAARSPLLLAPAAAPGARAASITSSAVLPSATSGKRAISTARSAGWQQSSSSARARNALTLAVTGAMAGASTAAASSEEEDAEVKALRDSKVVVVSIPACPYCKRAKEALSSKQIPYLDLDVSPYAGVRKAVKALTGAQTVPQVRSSTPLHTHATHPH